VGVQVSLRAPRLYDLQLIFLISLLQAVPLVHVAVHVNQDNARGLMGSSQLFEDFAPRLTYPMRLSRWPARFSEAARLLLVITVIPTVKEKS
jgi:hypothetical protein